MSLGRLVSQSWRRSTGQLLTQINIHYTSFLGLWAIFGIFLQGRFLGDFPEMFVNFWGGFRSNGLGSPRHSFTTCSSGRSTFRQPLQSSAYAVQSVLQGFPTSTTRVSSAHTNLNIPTLAPDQKSCAPRVYAASGTQTIISDIQRPASFMARPGMPAVRRMGRCPMRFEGIGFDQA